MATKPADPQNTPERCAQPRSFYRDLAETIALYATLATITLVMVSALLAIGTLDKSEEKNTTECEVA